MSNGIRGRVQYVPELDSNVFFGDKEGYLIKFDPKYTDYKEGRFILEFIKDNAK